MSDDPKPDTDEAIRFLEWLRPAGPWLLSAKVPDGAFETRSCADLGAAREWIGARNGRSNLYVMVNTAMKAADKKAKKVDVAEVAYLHVDLDVKQGPLEEGLARIREALADFEPSPSGVIFSGGGYWAFWRLDAPLSIGGAEAQIAAAEAYNRQLEEVLGGDHCFNVDRICRIPGTINLPDEAKRKRGRTAARASIVELTERDYPLHEFTAAPEERMPQRRAAASPARRDDVRPLGDPAELDAWDVPLWARAVIVEGSDPTDPGRWGGDRSKAVYAVVCQLVRCGAPPGLIVGILTDRTWGISAHIQAQKNPVDYAWRQVERAGREVEAEGEPFQTDKEGKRLPNQHNVRLALTKMGVTVRFDTFADRPTVDGLPGFGPHLDDAAMARLWLRMIEEQHISVRKDFFWTVVEDAAKRAEFHPVVEYLGGLEWDGVERLDHWMTVYLRADDSEYTRHVGTIMLTAAVRRVRQPGCKFDEMVVLESEQGKSKSTALSILAVREDWFSDDLPLGAESKVVIERTQGRWMIEAAELAGMSKKSIENLKAFQSRRVDRSRMAYGRLPHEAPRHFIVVGTTNDDRYLSDSTGNRRFWPVRVGDIDLEALERDRDQLWAEAAARESAGASIRLDRALWQAAAVEQEGRRLVDPFVHVLGDVLGDLSGKVLSKDVWEVIGTPVGLRTPQLEARLGSSMRELGFEHGQRRFGGNPEACYLRGTKEERACRIVVARYMDGDANLGPWTAHHERNSAEREGDPY